MPLSSSYISLALVDHLEIWVHEMPPLYILNTADNGLNPQNPKSNPKESVSPSRWHNK